MQAAEPVEHAAHPVADEALRAVLRVGPGPERGETDEGRLLQDPVERRTVDQGVGQPGGAGRPEHCGGTPADAWVHVEQSHRLVRGREHDGQVGRHQRGRPADVHPSDRDHRGALVTAARRNATRSFR